MKTIIILLLLLVRVVTSIYPAFVDKDYYPSVALTLFYGNETSLLFQWESPGINKLSDPIYVYKVKIWQLTPVKKIKHILSKRKQVQKVIEERLPPFEINKDPAGDADLVQIPAGDKNEFEYDGIHRTGAYEIHVLMVSKKGKVQPLNKMRVVLGSKEMYNKSSLLP